MSSSTLDTYLRSAINPEPGTEGAWRWNVFITDWLGYFPEAGWELVINHPSHMWFKVPGLEDALREAGWYEHKRDVWRHDIPGGQWRHP